MTDPRTRAREVAAQIIGTCRDLSEFASDRYLNDMDFCREIDAHAFQCITCGWWFDPDDRGSAPDEEPECEACLLLGPP